MKSDSESLQYAPTLIKRHNFNPTEYIRNDNNAEPKWVSKLVPSEDSRRFTALETKVIVLASIKDELTNIENFTVLRNTFKNRVLTGFKTKYVINDDYRSRSTGETVLMSLFQESGIISQSELSNELKFWNQPFGSTSNQILRV